MSNFAGGRNVSGMLTSDADVRAYVPTNGKKSADFGLQVFCYIALPIVICLVGVARARSEAVCPGADPVRFSLNGVEYRIPAALQPTYSPEQALSTQDYFPNGVRAKQYCQSP